MQEYKAKTARGEGKGKSDFKLPKIFLGNQSRVRSEETEEGMKFEIQFSGKKAEIWEIEGKNGEGRLGKKSFGRGNGIGGMKKSGDLKMNGKKVVKDEGRRGVGKVGGMAESKSVEQHSSRGMLPKISFSGFSIIKTSEEEFLETDEIKEISSESEESEKPLQEMNEVLISIQSELLNEILRSVLQDLSSQAVNEALLAYLQLSSNKILYTYIKEVLDEFIPTIAKSAYNESKEKEPSEIRDEIADEVFEEEFWKAVRALNNHKIAKDIAYEYVKLLPLEGYIQECIEETEKSNKKRVLKTFDYLIDSIIEEEWVEILAEDMINCMRIEQNWTLLPPYLQKEVGKKQQTKIIEILAERVYFDVLNEVVGGMWIKCICENCFFAAEPESLETLMPIPKFSIKKSSH